MNEHFCIYDRRVKIIRSKNDNRKKYNYPKRERERERERERIESFIEQPE